MPTGRFLERGACMRLQSGSVLCDVCLGVLDIKCTLRPRPRPRTALTEAHTEDNRMYLTCCIYVYDSKPFERIERSLKGVCASCLRHHFALLPVCPCRKCPWGKCPLNMDGYACRPELICKIDLQNNTYRVSSERR